MVPYRGKPASNPTRIGVEHDSVRLHRSKPSCGSASSVLTDSQTKSIRMRCVHCKKCLHLLQNTNACGEPRPEAAAQRRLLGVGSSAIFGTDAPPCAAPGRPPAPTPALCTGLTPHPT